MMVSKIEPVMLEKRMKQKFVSVDSYIITRSLEPRIRCCSRCSSTYFKMKGEIEIEHPLPNHSTTQNDRGSDPLPDNPYRGCDPLPDKKEWPFTLQPYQLPNSLLHFLSVPIFLLRKNQLSLAVIQFRIPYTTFKSLYNFQNSRTLTFILLA